MKFTDAAETKKTMNKLGKTGTPYLAIISYDAKNNYIVPLSDIDNNQILFSFPSTSNCSNLKRNSADSKVSIKFNAVPYSHYKSSFDKIKKHIKRGDTYLCNLTFETEIKTNKNLRDIFFSAGSKYKLWVKDEFVCFSPESFVITEDNIIKTYPMKGTIDADEENAKYNLLNNEKEKAEHYTITDLLRNDLSIIGKKAEVNKYRYVEKIRTSRNNLLQTSSEISAELQEGWHNYTGDMIFKLLPAGSISGAPKKKTIEIIKNTESHKRGFYTGVALIFDGKNINSFVMIRMICKEKNKYFYKSGGGITSFSDAKQEYNEMIQKIYVPVY